MSFWDRVTGSDMNRAYRNLEKRAKKLPKEYRMVWEKIKHYLWPHSDITGRNLIPIFDGVMGLLEEKVADGLGVEEVLGDDIEAFCAGLTSEESAQSFRDRWRKQLNSNIARKLGK